MSKILNSVQQRDNRQKVPFAHTEHATAASQCEKDRFVGFLFPKIQNADLPIAGAQRIPQPLAAKNTIISAFLLGLDAPRVPIQLSAFAARSSEPNMSSTHPGVFKTVNRGSNQADPHCDETASSTHPYRGAETARCL